MRWSVRSSCAQSARVGEAIAPGSAVAEVAAKSAIIIFAASQALTSELVGTRAVAEVPAVVVGEADEPHAPSREQQAKKARSGRARGELSDLTPALSATW